MFKPGAHRPYSPRALSGGPEGAPGGWWLLAALLAASLACSLPSLQATPTPDPAAAETALAGTLASAFTQTALVAPPTATPTITSTPEPSATPTITVTPTPLTPSALLSENTHCRTGPLAIYDLLATVLTGQEVKILGKNAAGDYWYIVSPSGRECWMWGRYATVSGDVSLVPVFTPPPTPTPSFVWTGTWSVWIDGIPGTMVLTQSGSSVTGTVLAAGDNYTLTGTTSNGGRDLSGDVFSDVPADVADYDFHMLDNMDQFRGSFTDPDPGEWCGARDGAGMPSPCVWP